MGVFSKPNGPQALALLIMGLVLAMLCLIAATVAWGERPGDTVELTAVFRDSLGVAIHPTTATAYVVKNGSPVDSSKTLANSGITSYRSKLLKWRYTIPAATVDSSRFNFYIRASLTTGTGITDDWLTCTPATVLVHDGTVDSLSPASVVDLFVGEADSTFTIIDATDAGQILDSGNDPVTGAFVFASLNSNLTSIIGFAKSTLGNYYLTVPLDPVAADTFYVSAWYQNSWLKSATMVTK